MIKLGKERIAKEKMYANLMGINEKIENIQATEIKKTTMKQIENTKQNEKFIKRGYYITEKQMKAITLKTAENPYLDKSGVVREALNNYLSDILEKI